MHRDGSSVGNMVILIGFLVGAAMTQSAWADGATRDLSGYSGPGVAFTVSIALDPPAGTIVAGVEESPPTGWLASNISDSGTWDGGTEEVKWGPLFDPSIPATVTYDLTPPGGATGEHCFTGTVIFDTQNGPIGGDTCLGLTIPTLSEWGVVAMALLVLTAGTLIFGKRAGLNPAATPPGT